MTGVAFSWPVAVALRCVVLGAAASLAARCIAAEQVGVGLLAAGVACVALTSLIAAAARVPTGQRAPVAICALIVTYAFVTSFAIPIDGSLEASHQHGGGHGHAPTTT